MQTAAGPRLASALAAALSVATITAFAVAPLSNEAVPARAKVIESVALPTPVAEPSDALYVRQAVIAHGETLGSLMRKLGDFNPELVEFVRNDAIARQLLSLRPGVTVTAQVDARNRIQTVEYPLLGSADQSAGQNDGTGQSTSGSRLDIVKSSGRWRAQASATELQRLIETRTATVQTTLFAATDAAGIPESVATRLSDVFSSDIDFHRDVKPGDTLRLVYEVLHNPRANGEGKPGRILAVEYLGTSRRLTALWFERSEGGGEYYDFDGHRLKRSFLRSPMEFTRITSGFSNGRRHPVFRDWRVHKGVDYAAPIGTPVRSVGEGTLEFIGRQRGYGNVIIVRHDDERQSLYAHLSRFAPSLSTGDRIARGQRIGHVGRTGWATGPHLHFEFLVNGEQVDPQQVIPPPPAPLDQVDLVRFEQLRNAFMSTVSDLAALATTRFE